MNITNYLREKLIELTGYWIFKKKYLPVGTDFIIDIKTKINLDIRTIFDVGANIGNTANEYHKAFPQANIYAFEPINSIFNILKNNLQSIKNIAFYKLAFAEKVGFVEVKLFDETQHQLNSLKLGSMNPDQNSKTEKVEVDTVDEFLKKNKEIQEIDFLKIDTEGYEMEVLKGALGALQNGKIKMVYLEVGFSQLNLRHTNLAEIIHFFDSNDFSFFGLYDISIQRIGDKYHYGNALFIHDSVKTNYLLE